LEPDGRRLPLPARDAGGRARRAPGPLEPRRLGAVRVPPAAAVQEPGRVTAEGARPVDLRARCDAPLPLPVRPYLPSVPLRTPAPRRGAPEADRACAGDERRRVRRRAGGRAPRTG